MKKIVLIALAAAITCSSLSSCSSDSDPADVGSAASPTIDRGSREKESSKKGKARQEKNEHKDQRGDSSEGTGDSRSGRQRRDDSQEGADLATASAIVIDPEDAQNHGDVPPYTEIVAAEIRGRGEVVRITTTFAEDLPAAMDESTYMVVDTTIGEGDDKVHVYAEGEQDGWAGYITRGEGSREIDTFSVNGPTVAFELPWKDVGGARRFHWYAGSSWSRGTTAGTDFSFDSAPNDERAAYPGRRGRD